MPSAKYGRLAPKGKQEHRLIEAEGDKSILSAAWSPTGDRILYLEEDPVGDVTGLSRDVNGGSSIVIFPKSETAQLFEVVLLHDGRMMYAVPESGAMSDTCNYWVRRIDWSTGKRLDQPRRVTNWTSFCVSGGSPTTDDKRLAFLGWASRKSVYLADIEMPGISVRKPRQFTLDESDNYLLGWTLDSKSVIFVSSRNGNGAIYRQALDEDTPQRLANMMDFAGPVTSDGKWLIGVMKITGGAPKVQSQLVRVPISGGSPEPIFPVSDTVAPLCARSRGVPFCLLIERSEDRRHMILTGFDPNKGQGSELLRLELDPRSSGSCDISPDGTQVAVIAGPDEPIQIHSLHGLRTRSIPAVALTKKQFLSWAANGKGLFVTHETKAGSELVYVDLRGNAKTLWTNNAGLHPLGLQSPDGKKLAIQNSVYNGNMWMMDNF
jgi:dipeptidyl aminopeptidase/acylaminoacyl peptidase